MSEYYESIRDRLRARADQMELMIVAADAIRELEERLPEWIDPASQDRLPEWGQHTLCWVMNRDTREDQVVILDYMGHGEWDMREKYSVMAWMPLPLTPAQEDQHPWTPRAERKGPGD